MITYKDTEKEWRQCNL